MTINIDHVYNSKMFFIVQYLKYHLYYVTFCLTMYIVLNFYSLCIQINVNFNGALILKILNQLEYFLRLGECS